MLKIWGRADSSNVQAVMWCVGELALPHTRVDVGHRFGGTDTAEFIAMNPNRTVPVIEDDGITPLWESGAILRYLAARYGTGPFWPADPRARADVDRWAEWAKINTSLGFTGPVFWPVIRTPKANQNPAAIATGVTTLEAKFAIAEARLARHPWLAGDDFTLADIQFGTILYRYFTIPIARAPLPALRAYFDRLTDRPAYRTHVMVPYDALRAD